MSRLNPNAGAFVPSFAPPSVVITPVTAAAAAPVSSPAKTPVAAAKPALTVTSSQETKAPATAAKPTPAAKPPVAAATVEVETMQDDTNVDAASDRLVYSIEHLLQFQPICDTVPSYFPDVVRAPAPQRLGRYLNDRLVYSVSELLLFQPLYQMFPPDLEWSETLAIVSDSVDKKAKTPAKQSKKEKAKAKAAAAAAAASGADQLQYDPTLMCYFNPTEYAAALNMAVYGSANAGAEKGASSAGAAAPSPGKPVVTALNPVEEAIVAKKRLATLLNGLQADSVASLLQSFEEIQITCTHTLQEVISQLFDRAIAAPALCDAYAQLFSGMAERTPEFKEGAKTINFRRVLLTRCYEALIEEPEGTADPPSSKPAATSTAATTNGTSATSMPSGTAQHSWRRQCMLRNVYFVGELFRRQLLTENIMHVCVAMMLEDEENPQMDVIDAACRLLMLVGDLLDGSSPASRRTMDEYFDVLQRLAEHEAATQSLKDTIAEMTGVRTGGWTRKRLDSVAAVSSPGKPGATVPIDPVAAAVTAAIASADDEATACETEVEPLASTATS